jgi:predicted restriction endonuclease
MTVIICKKCGNRFYTRPARIKVGKGKFCSKACYHEYSIGKKHTEEHRRNISIALKGRRQTIKERVNKSISMKNRDWGILKTPEKELFRKSIEMRLWRESVFARDNYTCQKCGVRGDKINAHHIENFSENPSLRTAIDNGITLCINCHIRFHKIFGKKTNIKHCIKWKLK